MRILFFILMAAFGLNVAFAQLNRVELATEVGVDEKIGSLIPLHLEFKDETGRSWTMAQLLDRPTLILPIFYHCPGTCSIMNAELADVLKRIGMPRGEEYRALSISFDDEETPAMAKTAKDAYRRTLEGSFPADQWLFLVGTRENIESLLAALAYRKKKLEKHSFVHPNVMMAIAPGGKVTRYLYGPEFLAADVQMALLEASKGRISISVRKLLTYCFDYDPQGKRYVLNVTRIFGTVTVVMVALIYFFLLRKTKRYRV